MTRETFIDVCKLLEKSSDATSAAYDAGISVIDYADDLHAVISTLMIEIFGEDIASAIDDFIYDGWDGSWWNSYGEEVKVLSYSELYDFILEVS